jgi:hypothetical protein
MVSFYSIIKINQKIQFSKIKIRTQKNKQAVQKNL